MRPVWSLFVPFAFAAHVVGATIPQAQRAATDIDLSERSIDALQEALRARRVTCRAVVDHCLRRIDAYDQRGPALNAIVTVNAKAAAEADRPNSAFFNIATRRVFEPTEKLFPLLPVAGLLTEF